MGKWQQGFVETNEIKQHYIRTGGEDKPQVVLCHGFSDNATCWTFLAQQLEADYDVIMVDARCHGQSDAPESGNDSSAMADDLAGTITALKLDRPVVAGHSMGASYTELFAARYPDMLHGLILEDSPWRDIPDMDAVAKNPNSEEMRSYMDEMKARIIGYKQNSIEALVAECEEEYPDWQPGTCNFTMKAHQELSLNIFTGRMLSLGGWKDNLPKITVPILEFTGDPELGGIVTDEMYAKASLLARDITRVHVEGVGHHIRFAAPEPYTKAFKAFLERIYEG